MKPTPTVAIIGATFWGNRGAEAMLATTIGSLRKRLPGCQFKVFSYYPVHDRQLVQAKDIEILPASPKALVLKIFLPSLVYGSLARLGLPVPVRLFPRAVCALQHSDVLLDLGGITFVDGREKYLPFNILTLLPAMILGVPVVKLSQAMGPFKHRLNRMAARWILARCAHVFARGSITAEHLSTLRLPQEGWSRAADVAFAYRPEYGLTEENEAAVGDMLALLDKYRQSGWTVIGLGPSEVMDARAARAGRDHVGEIVEALRRLGEAQPGRRFVVLPNATRQDTPATHNNDLPLIGRLRERAAHELPPDLIERIGWIDFDLNTRSIRALVSRCDVLVTSRFHAMVAGLALRVPTFVVGWSHKYLEVLAEFGVERNNLAVEAWVDTLPALVDEQLSGRTSSPALDVVERVVRSSESQFEEVERRLA